MNAPSKDDFARVAEEMRAELAAGNYPRVKALATILPDEAMPPDAPEPEAS